MIYGMSICTSVCVFNFVSTASCHYDLLQNDAYDDKQERN